MQDNRECLAVVAELLVHLIDWPVLNLECPFVNYCKKSDLTFFGEGLLFSFSFSDVVLCVLGQLRGVGLNYLIHLNG